MLTDVKSYIEKRIYSMSYVLPRGPSDFDIQHGMQVKPHSRNEHMRKPYTLQLDVQYDFGSTWKILVMIITIRRHRLLESAACSPSQPITVCFN